MSVGIAFRARLREPELLEELVTLVKTKAELRGWLTSDAAPVDLVAATLRGLDGREELRHGLTLRGLWLNPHFAADDLCLVFDAREGELMDPSRAQTLRSAEGLPVVLGFGATRTTWADMETQVGLVSLLEDLAGADLASVEMGDLEGRELAREPIPTEKRLHEARARVFAASLERPSEALRPAGPVELLAPAEARRLREQPPGAVEVLPERERAELLRSRESLLEAWLPSTPGLDGGPDLALAALERLTDLLLSHPRYRHDPRYLLETYAWESGVFLGFQLIEALGGHWERAQGARGPELRVVNLAGVGLVFRPLESAAARLRSGPLHAHDGVLRWLAKLAEPAREVYLSAR